MLERSRMRAPVSMTLREVDAVEDRIGVDCDRRRNNVPYFACATIH